jgi:hypothetical protein
VAYLFRIEDSVQTSGGIAKATVVPHDAINKVERDFRRRRSSATG